MRQVISISLAEDAVKKIKQRVKQGGFGSISEYFRYLSEEDSHDMISENELLLATKEAETEYKKGELKTFKSLKELA